MLVFIIAEIYIILLTNSFGYIGISNMTEAKFFDSTRTSTYRSRVKKSVVIVMKEKKIF